MIKENDSGDDELNDENDDSLDGDSANENSDENKANQDNEDNANYMNALDGAGDDENGRVEKNEGENGKDLKNLFDGDGTLRVEAFSFLITNLFPNTIVDFMPEKLGSLTKTILV